MIECLVWDGFGEEITNGGIIFYYQDAFCAGALFTFDHLFLPKFYDNPVATISPPKGQGQVLVPFTNLMGVGQTSGQDSEDVFNWRLPEHFELPARNGAISIRTKAIHLAIYANMTMIMRWMSMKMTKPQAMNRINLRSLDKARELE